MGRKKENISKEMRAQKTAKLQAWWEDIKTNHPERYHSECKKRQQSLTDEGRAKLSKQSRERFIGVPKTEIQKERMSQAKLGVLKSDEHKAAMAAAQTRRCDEIHMLQMQYGLYFRDAGAKRCEMMDAGIPIDVDPDQAELAQRANALLRSTAIKNPNKNDKLKTLFTLSFDEALDAIRC